MPTYEQPTFEPQQGSPAIYVLLDEQGNLIGAGSLDILEVIVDMSQRCARVIGGTPFTLTSPHAPTDYRSPSMTSGSELHAWNHCVWFHAVTPKLNFVGNFALSTRGTRSYNNGVLRWIAPLAN